MNEQPTHRFLAQCVRIVDQEGCWFRVVFEDGSGGWHLGPLIPIEVVEREAIC